MSQASFGVVLITAASRDQAVAIAQALVSQHLAACVNLFPIHSVYTWDGAVQQDDEWQLVVKTNLERWPELVQTVQDIHSYDVPELIALPIIEGSPAYLSWMGSMTTPVSSSQQMSSPKQPPDL